MSLHDNLYLFMCVHGLGGPVWKENRIKDMLTIFSYLEKNPWNCCESSIGYAEKIQINIQGEKEYNDADATSIRPTSCKNKRESQSEKYISLQWIHSLWLTLKSIMSEMQLRYMDSKAYKYQGNDWKSKLQGQILKIFWKCGKKEVLLENCNS